MTSSGKSAPAHHWLDLWASDFHNWQTLEDGHQTLFYRRQGIVENLFDTDGTDFEGRADINARLTVELRTSLDHASLRRHIAKVWAIFRHRHVLMAARSLQGNAFLSGSGGDCWLEKYFAYAVPRDEKSIMEDALSSISFLEDFYPGLDEEHFFLHGMNCSRVLDEKQHLAKLFVYPFKDSEAGTILLRTYMVAGHQIADGLTIYRWSADFIRLLNCTTQQLKQEIPFLCARGATVERLPPAQESLYPPRSNNRVRAQWHWLITRMLRHVRIPVPASFQNPLRREQPLEHAIDLPNTYSRVFGYSRKPPLNSFTVGFGISRRATHNLRRLCQQAGISRGSGSFVLVALVMMRLEEKYRPNVPLSDRLPFVGSFPVNPRPFLSGVPTTGKEDSVMLAFSDGVTLPFLPSSCDLQTSFRVLGRLAHRQLNQYQKKKKNGQQRIVLGSRHPQELLPALYLSTMERLEDRLLPERRAGLNPQGLYQARPGGSLATCGISSVGDVSGLIPQDVQGLVESKQTAAVVAKFRDLKSNVRAREGEFLVGSAGSKNHQGFGVSYDGSAIDPEKVMEWKQLLLDLLDYDMFDTAKL